MSLGLTIDSLRYQLNGERDFLYRRTNKIQAPIAPTPESQLPITPILSPTEPALPVMPVGTDPVKWAYDLCRTGYTTTGCENPDWLDPEPIMCMRSWPPGGITTAVCKPNKAALELMASKFKTPVIGIPQPDGSTVEVVTDANGEVIGERRKPANWLPLAAAAAAAYFFLM